MKRLVCLLIMLPLVAATTTLVLSTTVHGGVNDWTEVAYQVDAVVEATDCPEAFHLVGMVRGRDHYVTPSSDGGTVINNWHYWWEGATWTGITTGQIWLPIPGFTNGGFWKTEDGVLVGARNHEYWRLQNQTTGEVMRFTLDYRVLINAQGGLQVDDFSTSCDPRP